ncbi:transporter [soil metagenome]
MPVLEPSRAGALGGTIPGLVWGCHFDASGVATPVGDAGATGSSIGGWVWLHFNLTDNRARSWLAAFPTLPKIGAELLLSAEEAQQLVASDGCIRGVFFDLARSLERARDEFGNFRFVMIGRLLVSGRRRALNAAEVVRRDIENGQRFAAPPDLLRAVIDRTAEGIDHVVDELAADIDSIEDDLLKDRSADERQRLGRVRLTTVRIHRRLNGLRALFRRAVADHSDGPMATVQGFLGHLVQELDEIDRQVVELRDRAHLLQEEITIKLAEETNRHLHVLSVLTALLLPPSLIAGIFGMHVAGIPFAGNPLGFIGAVGFTIVASALALWVLYRTGVIRRRPRRQQQKDDPSPKI